MDGYSASTVRDLDISRQIDISSVIPDLKGSTVCSSCCGVGRVQSARFLGHVSSGLDLYCPAEPLVMVSVGEELGDPAVDTQVYDHDLSELCKTLTNSSSTENIGNVSTKIAAAQATTAAGRAITSGNKGSRSTSSTSSSSSSSRGGNTDQSMSIDRRHYHHHQQHRWKHINRPMASSSSAAAAAAAAARLGALLPTATSSGSSVRNNSDIWQG